MRSGFSGIREPITNMIHVFSLPLISTASFLAYVNNVEVDDEANLEIFGQIYILTLLLLLLLLFILTANGFLFGGSDTTIGHNTQIAHITQNNTPRSNKTQHTNLHKK
jgi:hypothetical protein